MKISAKTEYACLAMLQLASRYGTDQPVRIRDIAEVHNIPQRFLVQILLQLKGAGLVASTRGAAGGYQLLRPPEEITLGEVMAVIDGPEPEPVVASPAESPGAAVLHDAWREVADVQREMLSSLTFSGILERVKGRTLDMYYI